MGNHRSIDSLEFDDQTKSSLSSVRVLNLSCTYQKFLTKVTLFFLWEYLHSLNSYVPSWFQDWPYVDCVRCHTLFREVFPWCSIFFLYPRTNSSFDWIYLICCLLWKFRTLELGFFTLTLEKGNDDNYTYCCSALLYTSIKSIAFRRIKTLALEVTIFSPLISDSLIQESKKFEQVELVNVQQTDGTSIPAILLEMYPLSV